MWVYSVSAHSLKTFLAIWVLTSPLECPPHRDSLISCPPESHLAFGNWDPAGRTVHIIYTMDPSFASSSHTHAESPDGPGLHRPGGKCGGNLLWPHLSRQLAAPLSEGLASAGDKGCGRRTASRLSGYGKGHMALRLGLALTLLAGGSSVKQSQNH